MVVVRLGPGDRECWGGEREQAAEDDRCANPGGVK
jgi:hypothetical protein